MTIKIGKIEIDDVDSKEIQSLKGHLKKKRIDFKTFLLRWFEHDICDYGFLNMATSDENELIEKSKKFFKNVKKK